MAYHPRVEFVETHAFTRRIRALLTPDEYRAIQTALVLKPTAGDLIAGTGGFRKLRWQRSGIGKRGGVRVIYYLHRPSHRFLMLAAYGKNEQDDLTPGQKAILRRIVEGEYP